MYATSDQVWWWYWMIFFFFFTPTGSCVVSQQDRLCQGLVISVGGDILWYRECMLLVISVGGDILWYRECMLLVISVGVGILWYRECMLLVISVGGDTLTDFFFFYSYRKLCCIPTRQTVSGTCWKRPRNMYSSQKTAPANLGWYSIFSARPMQSFYDTHRHMRRGGVPV